MDQVLSPTVGVIDAAHLTLPTAPSPDAWLGGVRKRQNPNTRNSDVMAFRALSSMFTWGTQWP